MTPLASTARVFGPAGAAAALCTPVPFNHDERTLRGCALLPGRQPAGGKWLPRNWGTSSPSLYPFLTVARSSLSSTYITAAIRAVEDFDGNFELQEEAKQILFQLLGSDSFAYQVAEQPGVPEDAKYKFTGELFQPVPWSPNTKKGMPKEFEKYLDNKEHYVIINVPPNFMFKAKIFKPTRLCAVFENVAAHVS
eukprot:TRINITY_DN4377_c0_g2_i1.p1 TRINITY_DN4377_c0_g2~~TRINITY_DN4377_c0_g2_i1.p1  ORF type:complete len:194 (-),score=56.67 TRINITY_DN4377_c0_g2_i1:268-849(-)